MVILFGHPNRVPEYPTKLLPEWKKFGTRALVLDRILELPQVMDEAALPPPADVVPCTPGVADHDSSVVSEDLPRHILAARSRHLVDHGPPAQECPEPVVPALDAPGRLVPVAALLLDQLLLELPV